MVLASIPCPFFALLG